MHYVIDRRTLIRNISLITMGWQLSPTPIFARNSAQVLNSEMRARERANLAAIKDLSETTDRPDVQIKVMQAYVSSIGSALVARGGAQDREFLAREIRGVLAGERELTVEQVKGYTKAIPKNKEMIDEIIRASDEAVDALVITQLGLSTLGLFVSGNFIAFTGILLAGSALAIRWATPEYQSEFEENAAIRALTSNVASSIFRQKRQMEFAAGELIPASVLSSLRDPFQTPEFRESGVSRKIDEPFEVLGDIEVISGKITNIEAALFEIKSQAEKYARLDAERSEASSEAAAKALQAKKIDLEVRAGIYFSSLLIGRGLGEPGLAMHWEGIATRFYHAQKLQASYMKSGVGGLAVAGGWVSAMLFTYEVFQDRSERDPIVAIVLNEIRALREFTRQNFRFVQEQNFAILDLVTSGFYFTGGQLKVVEAVVRNIRQQVISLSTEGTQDTKEELDNAFRSAATTLEIAADTVASSGADLPPNALFSLNKALGDVSDHALLRAYSRAYSSSADTALTRAEIARRIRGTKDPDRLLGLIEPVVRLLGRPKLARSVPSLNQWSKGAATFSIAKVVFSENQTSLDNRFEVLLKEGRGLLETLGESVSLDLLELVQKKVLRSAATFVRKYSQLLDEYHTQVGNLHARHFYLPASKVEYGKKLGSQTVFAEPIKAAIDLGILSKRIGSQGINLMHLRGIAQAGFPSYVKGPGNRFVEFQFVSAPELGDLAGVKVGRLRPDLQPGERFCCVGNNDAPTIGYPATSLIHNSFGLFYHEAQPNNLLAYGKPLTIPDVSLAGGGKIDRYKLEGLESFNQLLTAAIDLYLERKRNQGLAHIAESIEGEEEFSDLSDWLEILSFIVSSIGYRYGAKLAREQWPSFPACSEVLRLVLAKQNDYSKSSIQSRYPFFEVYNSVNARGEPDKVGKKIKALLDASFHNEAAALIDKDLVIRLAEVGDLSSYVAYESIVNFVFAYDSWLHKLSTENPSSDYPGLRMTLDVVELATQVYTS